MENLSRYIPSVVFVAVMAFAITWAISPKAAKKAAVKTVMFVAAVALVALILLIPGLVRAEGWQEATVNGSVEVSVDDEPLYLVVYTTDDGQILSYFDDAELSKGTRIRVIISPYGETIDAEVEEEPVWFPPFFFFGALVAPVVNKSKKYKLAQTMPPDLYLPCKVWDIQVSIVYYVNSNRSFNTIALEPTIIKALKSNKVQDVAESYCNTVGKALNLLDRATAKEVPAYVVAYVPEYKQMAVVACNWLGFLEYWRNTAISDKVSAANALLRRDIQMIPESAEYKPISNKPSITRTPATDVKVISDKDDPFVQIVEVKYSDNDDRTFTFRCRQAHTPGDYVCVFTKRAGEATKTYKNVKVVKYTVMKESEVKALAKGLGYSDITEVYCDKAVDIPEAWSNWRDPADDPELYAPSAEEIADFEAMRETVLGSGYRDF